MDPRTRLRMHSERSVPQEIGDILRAGTVAHVAFSVEGQPYVIPMLYHYDDPHPPAVSPNGSGPAAAAAAPEGDSFGGRFYLHGSTRSRIMKHMAGGEPICVSVTHVDQLVASKTALNHSANYRSALCFGTGRVITDPDEKNEVLERMVSRYFEGRTVGRDYSRATSQHLKGTVLVELVVDGFSAKARRGPPNGPGDDDPAAAGTAYLLELL